MAMPANWYPDPAGRHQVRYWDGTAWTDHVANAGVTGTDSIASDTSPPVPAPVPTPSTGAGWMDKVKAVAQDVADQGKAAIDEMSSTKSANQSSPTGPTSANTASPSGSNSPPPTPMGSPAPVAQTSPPPTAASAQPPTTAAAPGQSTPHSDVASQLRKLADLRDEGVLTEEEFAAQKAKILGS